jgi:hypothetical protein
LIERSAAVGQPALRLLVHTIRYETDLPGASFRFSIRNKRKPWQVRFASFRFELDSERRLRRRFVSVPRDRRKRRKNRNRFDFPGFELYPRRASRYIWYGRYIWDNQSKLAARQANVTTKQKIVPNVAPYQM